MAAAILAACSVAIDDDELPPEGTPAPAGVVRPTPGAAVRPTLEPIDAATEPACYQPAMERLDPSASPEPPSERLRSPGPMPPPPSFQPLAFANDGELESRLRALLGEELDSYSVAVKELNGGTGVSINGDKSFYAASVFKVGVMFEVLHQRALGRLSFDEQLLVTPYYAGFDLGTLSVEVCDTIRLGDALARMMAVSDNASAVLLQDRVGSANVNAALGALGLTKTRLLEDDLPATAADLALLLEAVATGKAIDEAASQEMVNLLASEEIDNGLRAGTPADSLVAHKTGNWTNATHDVGIVYSPAATYIIAVLSDKGYDAEDVVPIEDIARLVWEYYNGAGAGDAPSEDQ